MLALPENTKVGVTLNYHIGLPPTVFTQAYTVDFRGVFRTFLRDTFKGPELAKIKALIFSMSIAYVFFMKKGCIFSYDHIHDFLENMSGLTSRKHPNAFAQLVSRMHNANTKVTKKSPYKGKFIQVVNANDFLALQGKNNISFYHGNMYMISINISRP